MTFTFSLVLGLFLLAPGFAVFAGIYHGSASGPVHSPPPPPGSILALAIVTFGALAAHFVGSLAFLIQDGFCEANHHCIGVPFNPNAYASLFLLADSKSIEPIQGFEILGSLLALSWFAFAAAQLAIKKAPPQGALRRLLYGWLDQVAVAKSKDEFILAYVLSDIQDDGTVLGYEGAVANLTIDVDKEITSILLTDCETFYLRVTAEGVAREKVDRSLPIPQLYLDRSRVKNIAFDRLKLISSSTTAD